MGYRMIIADDEEMLIRLIRNLGHFEQLGIEVVDECRDGEEACDSILRNNPDFVLTDIQMPVLDGLEMIDRVCQINPDVLFVLLSGYRYFEYAQSAIRLNVVDYLLKPVEEAQLNQILERLCRLTDERRRRESDRATYRQMCDSRKREKQMEFWKEITAPGNRMDPALLQPERLRQKYEIDLPHKNMQMLFLNTDFSLGSSMAVFSYVEDLNRNAENAFGGKAVHYQQDFDYGFFVLLNFDPSKAQNVRNAISAFYYNCNEQWEKYLEYSITLGISQIYSIPAQFPDLVKEAGIAAWGRMVLSSSPTIRYDHLLTMEHFRVSAILTESRRKKLWDGIHYLKQQDIADVFSALRKDMMLHRYSFPGDILNLFEELTEIIRSSVAQEYLTQVSFLCGKAARGSRDCIDLLQKLYAVAENYVTEQKKALEAKNRKPVELVMEYTHQNFSKDISLESAAEAIGLSPSYLSRIFKEAAGIGFNDYLTKLRVEESKRLLANTTLSVREVASAVGYVDEKYYSKLFKKQFGIKPTEYRKLYG